MSQMRGKCFKAFADGADEILHVLHLPHFTLCVDLQDAQAVPQFPAIARLFLPIALQHAIVHAGTRWTTALIRVIGVEGVTRRDQIARLAHRLSYFRLFFCG